MNAPLYTTEILRLAASLQGPRPLERIDGRAELRSPTCGSRINIAIQLDSNRRVEAISQEVHACAFGQASAALVEQYAVGRDLCEVSDALIILARWLAQEQEEIGSLPGLMALAPARERNSRHSAILLPFRALVAAMDSAR